jgi:hypothetical protein
MNKPRPARGDMVPSKNVTAAGQAAAPGGPPAAALRRAPSLLRASETNAPSQHSRRAAGGPLETLCAVAAE